MHSIMGALYLLEAGERCIHMVLNIGQTIFKPGLVTALLKMASLCVHLKFLHRTIPIKLFSSQME